MRTKSDSADKVYSNRQTLRDCFMLRVLYKGKTKKNERLLKTKQCSANSLPLQTVASHCFNVTFRFLSLSKHTEQSPESIPQCLSIGKISVAIWFLLSRKKNSTWDGKSIVRRIVQGRYWRDYKKLYTSMFHSYFNEYAFDDIFNVLNPIDN